MKNFDKQRGECSGDLDECASRSCDLNKCPLMINLVHQVFQLASADKDEDYVYLKYLTESVMKAGSIQSETVILAKMKAERKALAQRAQHTQEIMGTIKEKDSLLSVFDILHEGNHTRLDDLDKEILVMERKLNVKTH